MSKQIQVTRLPSLNPAPPAAGKSPTHWVGSPPKSFVNPWESFRKDSWGLRSILQIRYGKDRNFVPIPEDKSELVQVRKPDWGRAVEGWQDNLKATWLGHAGFLVELPIASHSSEMSRTPTHGDTPRYDHTGGIRVLIDAVFAERMSPFSCVGPKRFRDVPCTIDELPEVDICLFSHNHYDHMDVETITALLTKQRDHTPHFLTTLGNRDWFLDLGLGTDQVTECDWWDSVSVSVPSKGDVVFHCLPSQHNSGRGILDQGRTLWSSWAIKTQSTTTRRPASASFSSPAAHIPSITTTMATPTSTTPTSPTTASAGKSLYFAGDTAYKSHYSKTPCPVFSQIGQVLGPFDLALLPIGCYSPRHWMSNVHASPEDSLQIHNEIGSRKSIGMHYGVIRGGLSSQYEDVREPLRVWREAAEKAGKWDSGECGLCEIGETVSV